MHSLVFVGAVASKGDTWMEQWNLCTASLAARPWLPSTTLPSLRRWLADLCAGMALCARVRAQYCA